MLSIILTSAAACSVKFNNSRITSLNIEARRYFNEGVRLGQEGRTDDAIRAYTRSIEIDPGAGAYNNRSAEYVKKSKYDMAVTDANKAILMNGKYAMPYVNRGNAFFKMSNFKSALKSYLRAIAIGPVQTEFYFNCARAYYRLDMPRESVEMYEKAVEMDPGCYAAYYNLACIYAMQNNAPKALECLDRAIAEGFADAVRLGQEPALENIRTLPGFRVLVRKIEKKGAVER